MAAKRVVPPAFSQAFLHPPQGRGRPIPVEYEPYDVSWDCYGDPTPSPTRTQDLAQEKSQVVHQPNSRS